MPRTPPLWPLLKRLPCRCGGCRREDRRQADRNLVRRRGSHWPEEQDHTALGEAWHTAICAARSANGLGLYFRRHLPAARQGRGIGFTVLQHRGDGLASRIDRRCSRARRTRHSRPRSSGMARLEDAPSAAQHYTRVIAAEIARTQPGRKYLAVHEGQLAVKPSFHLLREHRRPLLLCLEQTRRPAMADHVHRNSPVGKPVMLMKTWY